MNEEHYDDEHDEFDDEPANTGWLTNTPYWLISVVAHGILLFVLGGIVILEVHEEKEEPAPAGD